MKRRKIGKFAGGSIAISKPKWLTSINVKRYTLLALEQLAAAGMAALMQDVSLSSTVYPVGLALVAGTNKKYTLAVTLGFIVGGLINGVSATAVYISAAAVAAAVRFVLIRKKLSAKQLLLAGVVSTTLTLFLSRVSVMWISGQASFSAIMLIVCECVLIVILAGFFHISTGYIVKRERDIPAAHKICIYVCVFLSAAALFPLSIGFVSIGRIAVFWALMLVCFALPEFAVGAAAFCAAALIAVEAPYYFAAAAMCVASCVALTFRRHAKPIFTVAFLICGYACALIAPNTTFALIYICEISVSAAVFMLTPSALIARVFPATKTPTRAGALATARLSAISLSFTELSSLLERICTVIPKHEIASTIITRTADTVCRDCTMMSFCWVRHYSDTVSCLEKLVEKMRTGGKVDSSDLGAELRACCINPVSLCGEINRGHSAISAAVKRDRNTALYRTVLYKQFAAIGAMLEKTELALATISDGDAKTDAMIRLAASDLGQTLTDAQCAFVGDRLHAALSFVKIPSNEIRRLLVQKISTIAGRAMCEAQTTVSDAGASIEYCEQPRLCLKTACYQNNPHTECGDSYSIFGDASGRSHIIIADGMGTGPAATLDSAICCTFMRRLLENGFDGEEGARLVNAAMAIKDEGETAVTVDSLCFDGYTGSAVFLKAGAAPTYLYTNRKIDAICHPTLPVGIMDDVCVNTHETRLAEGDITVMLTDGAIDVCSVPLSSLIQTLCAQEPETILEEIIDAAGGFVGAKDDITIIVAKVTATQ